MHHILHTRYYCTWGRFMDRDKSYLKYVSVGRYVFKIFRGQRGPAQSIRALRYHQPRVRQFGVRRTSRPHTCLVEQ